MWEEKPPGFLTHILLLVTFSWIRCWFSILEKSEQQEIERTREVGIRVIQCTILRNKINSKCLRLSQENYLGINNSSCHCLLKEIDGACPLVVSVSVYASFLRSWFLKCHSVTLKGLWFGFDNLLVNSESLCRSLRISLSLSQMFYSTKGDYIFQTTML